MSDIKLGRRPGLVAARPSDIGIGAAGVMGGPGVYGVYSVAVDAASEAAGVVKVEAVAATQEVGVGGIVSDNDRRFGLGRFIGGG